MTVHEKINFRGKFKNCYPGENIFKTWHNLLGMMEDKEYDIVNNMLVFKLGDITIKHAKKKKVLSDVYLGFVIHGNYLGELQIIRPSRPKTHILANYVHSHAPQHCSEKVPRFMQMCLGDINVPLVSLDYEADPQTNMMFFEEIFSMITWQNTRDVHVNANDIESLSRNIKAYEDPKVYLEKWLLDNPFPFDIKYRKGIQLLENEYTNAFFETMLSDVVYLDGIYYNNSIKTTNFEKYKLDEAVAFWFKGSPVKCPVVNKEQFLNSRFNPNSIKYVKDSIKYNIEKALCTEYEQIGQSLPDLGVYEQSSVPV